MNKKTITWLCASLVAMAGAHASTSASFRPSVEVTPGVVVAADNISTSRVPGAVGDLTFTGDVAITDAAGTRTSAWAAFSPGSMQLTVDGERAGSICGGATGCCSNGAYYRLIRGSEIFVGRPTKANPYSEGNGTRLYCVGNSIQFV